MKKEVKNISNVNNRRSVNKKVRTTQSTRNSVNQAVAPVKRQTAVTPSIFDF